MARLKRKITTFSLSFLDIMACGFGAVTLLFLILKHNPISTEFIDLAGTSEKKILLEEIQTGKENLLRLKNTLTITDENTVKIIENIKKIQEAAPKQLDTEKELDVLKKQIFTLEEKIQLLKEQDNGKNIRKFLGDGERQYLTGLKLSGKRIVILVDASASMLSDSIVNVIRMRNMDDESKKNSPKWRRAIKTTEWLITQMPKDSQYQIYTFNSLAKSISSNNGVWRNTQDLSSLNFSIQELKKVIPNGGTNLAKAFQTIASLRKSPDNIFLITDGLPTQGNKKKRNVTITASDRMKLFQESLKELPSRTPVNILLFPMEGDPFAAASYWRLAISTKGSFMSPSRDWP